MVWRGEKVKDGLGRREGEGWSLENEYGWDGMGGEKGSDGLGRSK